MKRTKYIIIVVFVLLFGILYRFYYAGKNTVNYQGSNLAIMLETEPGVYTKSASSNWPSSNEYVFDEDKSYCTHGSDIYFINNKIQIESVGKDKCFAYFKNIDNITEEISARVIELNGGKKSIEAKTINTPPNFGAVEQNNVGVFAASDEHGTSYYFRGAVDNNWVKFGKNSSSQDMWWRIVRINGDGSVKLIYTGTTAPIESEKVVMTGAKTQATSKTFNAAKNKAEFTGYMYEEAKHRGHQFSSIIKQELDTWYTTNLSDYEEYLNDFIVCNDRSFRDGWIPINLPGTTIYSNAYDRQHINNKPQLLCPHLEDAYTVNDESNGNGKLTNPIGLLTADEITLAGGYRTTANTDFYLYTNEYYWLVSPFGVSATDAFGFFVTANGNLSSSNMSVIRGVRPVISLSPDVEMVGTGQWNDPYRIQEFFFETILAANGGEDYIESKPSPNFASIAATNEGLYSKQDDLGTSYYFRGAVDNNWVKFGKNSLNLDIWWRIIRINGDNSVRMLYTGTTAPIISEKSVMIGTKTQASADNYNTGSRSEYLGYMYTTSVLHGHGTSSVAKTAAESWYSSNMSSYDAFIHDGIFCSDRTVYVGKVGGTNYTGDGMGGIFTSSAFAPASRLYGTNSWTPDGTGPVLTCTSQEDRYTKADIINGNGKLSQKVGLITADEINLAGAISGTESSNHSDATKNYVYNGENTWTMSPGAYNISFQGVFFVTNYGYLNFNYINKSRGIRPVINLIPEIIVSGSGEWNDPYIPIIE